MDSGIAIRCGSCRGGGWLDGWFKRCRYCRGRGWFDPVSAPGGIGPLVAAADAVRTGAAYGLLLRPALPWEHFPIPSELKSREGAPDDQIWDRAVRNSAVILYEHSDGRLTLAGGLELAQLRETHALLRDLCWERSEDKLLWRCVDRELRDVYLRLSFFQAWRGEWLEITRQEREGEPKIPAPPQTPLGGSLPPTPTEISGEAQKYVTGKLFVGVPKEEDK